MCSIILAIGPGGVFAGANRDERTDRAWDLPAEYWPDICGGRDRTGGGTWLALNRAGVMAAVLNREGTLGPAPGKESRGKLPLLALQHRSAAAAAAAVGALDAGAYRAFNLVIADQAGAFLLRGLEHGRPDILALTPGVHMITAGEPDDLAHPRIARHLPKFAAAAFSQWGTLLADKTGPRAAQLNIDAQQNAGFGTVCASLVSLPRGASPVQKFSAGPPDAAEFRTRDW